MATIPETQQTITPYLIIENAPAFIAFMQTVFGAKETSRHMRDETTIMHAELVMGNSTIMLAEKSGSWNVNTSGMFIYVDNTDERYKLALENGASSMAEPADQSYGRSCGVMDSFGNIWWITSPL